MKKKGIVILSVLLLLSILLNLWNLFTDNNVVQVKEGSISTYQHMIDGYVPENGYISDEKTAVKIAKAIFESWGIRYGLYTVEYDEIEQLWIVDSSFLLQKGGYVVIQKQDGKIVRAWMKK